MGRYYPIIVFCASIFIIILAFFTTRIISGGINSKISNRNIKFIEKMPLGVDKSLILIELDNHFYLMYLSKNGAQLIDKLDSLKIKEQVSENISFKDILSNFKKFKDK
ncbi:flagellar biosynthetic protein FliO [Maledivibacter halophilus]|uniref:Flagellar biogenesis protein n=1 Tax=Maledivibacter halophilus TaxID=36842 RepID=A0A1T5LE69_9FIRM|nr:flagellar biosynthetic protein FliO [Maledivibacter halophilus]SKC74336.1 Flagellar biogenesis protein [Maledivibacter halophilus]